MTTIPKLTILRRTLAFVGACAAMAVAPMSFAAVPGDSVPTATVRYNDLNLSTPAGVNALYRRIRTAATEVCPNPDARDLSAARAVKQCRVEATARAVRDVNNPQLALVHAARAQHS
jgi:UrcA family protein